MADEHFLTTEEVLDYLQVNLRTVYRLIKSRKLPATRVGRQWRFRRRDLDIWLSNNRTHVGSGPPDKARILVVDDEEAVRDLIARSLSAAEYDVETAEDGATAVERMRANDYDLLITDLKMPGMDGLSVIREARRKSADMPIIIITGFSTKSSAIEAVNLGVAGYLTKPFQVSQVLAAAARAIGA